MTEMVKGRTTDEATGIVDDFVSMLMTDGASAAYSMNAERIALLETIRKFPARTRCAALPWATQRAFTTQSSRKGLDI